MFSFSFVFSDGYAVRKVSVIISWRGREELRPPSWDRGHRGEESNLGHPGYKAGGLPTRP